MQSPIDGRSRELYRSAGLVTQHVEQATGTLGAAVWNVRRSAAATLRAFAGSATGTRVLGGVTVCSAVVLARLVPAAAFGEAALPTAVVAIATVLTVQGVATPLVQMKDIDRRDLPHSCIR